MNLRFVESLSWGIPVRSVLRESCNNRQFNRDDIRLSSYFSRMIRDVNERVVMDA